MKRLIILLLITVSVHMLASAETNSSPTMDSVAVNLDSIADVSCFGGNDGAAFISVNGGTGPYSFEWSNGDTLQNADSLSAGAYSVTVFDSEGQQATLDGIVIAEPTAVQVGVLELVLPDCNGLLGSIKIEATGGQEPYSYAWNTGATTDKIIDLAAGDYIPTVTDAHGCTGTILISLQPEYPIAALVADGNITCAHPSVVLDGSASSQGGNFVFAWNASNGGHFTSTTLDTLVVTTDTAGTYSLTITDTLTGCSTTATLDITEDLVQPLADAGIDFNLPCTNSSANLNGSGSTGSNIVYHWDYDNGGSFTAGTDSLTPTIGHVGTFILTVANLENGCSSSDTVEVMATNAPPVFSVEGGTLTCSAIEVQLTTDLDTMGVVYQWTGDNGFTSAELQPLVSAAGAYTLTATDTTTACSDARVAYVLENTVAPVVDASAGTITCANSSASIAANAQGDNLTFSWTGPNGFTSSDASTDVSEPGDYIVLVTDTVNGCSTQDTATVNADLVAPIADAGSGGTLTCAVTSLTLDGSASSQGAEFTYEWTTLDGDIAGGQNTLNPVVVAPGTYSLTVTNTINGCTDDDGDVVVDSDYAAPTNVSAEGGTITCFEPTLQLQSSFDPLNTTIAWSSDNGFSSTEPNPTVDAGGDYVLTVTDTLNGCFATDTASVIAYLDAPDLDLTGGTITCTNTTVTIQATSQTPDVVFYWSGPNNFASSEQNPTVDMPGQYELVIQDTVYGCIVLDSITIEIDTLSPIADAGADFNFNCHFSQANLDGSASSQGDFSYAWTTADGNIVEGESTQAPLVNATGTYTLTVTNINTGCTATDEVTIGQNAPVSIQILDLQNVDCHGDATGSASVEGMGGTGEYTYVWTNGSMTNSATGLVAGDYTVVVTDGDGCTAANILTVQQPDVLAANVTATGQTAVGVNDGTASSNPSGGTAPYSYAWSNNEITQSIAGLAPGAYTVSVTDDKGCVAVETANVLEFPCTLTGAVTAQPVTCFGGGDGSATVSLQGETVPITYAWSNGDTLASVNGLVAGMYTVSITDSTNCSLLFTVEITEPTELTAFEFFHEDVLCPTDSTGFIAIAINGGVQPYEVNWSNGSNEPTIDGLGIGDYSVSITDANGCNTTLATSIIGTDTEGPTVVVQDLITISLGADGTANIEASQLDAGSIDNCGIVAWEVSPNAFDCSHLGNQVVMVTATDASGNSNQALAMVSVVDDIAPVLVCQGNVNISLCAPTVVFELPGVTDNCPVDFSQLQQTAGLPSASDFPAGETVQTFAYTDSAGNVGTCSFTVNVADALEVAVTSSNISCNGACDGSANITPSFGLEPYSILWSNGTTGSSISDLCPGEYLATITDESGCEVQVTVVITEPAPLAINLDNTTNPVCPNDETGAISVSVTGGTGDYSFSWSNGGDSSSIDGLAAGSYVLSVTDANGCTAIFEQMLVSSDTEAPVLSLENIFVSLDANGTAPLTPDMFDSGSSDNCGIDAWAVSPSSVDCSDLGTLTITVTALDAAGNTATGTATVTVVDNTAPTLICPSNIEVGYCDSEVQFTLPVISDNCTVNPALLQQTAGLPLGSDFPTGTTTQTYSYTDIAGNPATCSFSITVHAEPSSIGIDIQEASCNGACDGVASLNILGGFPPFTVNWSNGQIGNTATGLCAGVISASITDAAGCMGTLSVTIDEPSALSFTLNTVVDDLHGTGVGSIDITVAGGTAPYSFAWKKNGQAFAATEDLANLNTGNYEVVVTDANGCTITTDAIFVDNLTGTDEPAWASNLQLFPNPANDRTAMTFGQPLPQDAELRLLDATGKLAYSLNLKKGEVAKTIELNSLPAGAYTVQVRMASGLATKQLIISK